MHRAAAVKTEDTNIVPRVSNDCSASSERFEPVSGLLERFELESDRMFRQLQPS